MPLYALRAFECAGRYLHMGRAGEELGVTHGAISHQIRSLEEQLGVRLFDRAKNKLQLTDAGARLLQSIKEGFDTIIEGALHLEPDSLPGSLIVGCTQTAGASWAAKAICEFNAQYPQIEVQVVELKPQQKEIPLEVDVAICYGAPHDAGLRLVELGKPPIFPVCNPRLLHDKKKVSKPKDLVNFTLLHDKQNSWERWFSEFKVDVSNDLKQIQFFSTSLALSAARSGHGVALCNRFEVQEDLKEGSMVQLLDSAIPETHSYYMLLDQPENQSIRARLFEEWMEHVLE